MKNSRDLIIGQNHSDLTESNFVLPRLIQTAGPMATKRCWEFFSARIRNKNTRESYMRAVLQFGSWCDHNQLRIEQLEPTIVATYIELIGKRLADTTVKQHLAAIRMFFDYLVTGGILRHNPSTSVRGPKVVIKQGKTPVLSSVEARRLLDSIDTSKIAGLRDRALIGIMIYSFARVGAAVAMNVRDLYAKNGRLWIRLHEKGGRYHEMPLHKNAENFLNEYILSAQIKGQRDTPLFRTLDRKRNLTGRRMLRQDAWGMIKRLASKVGLSDDICNHSCRATGITEYMRNGGTLENAQQMAAHASSRTTSLYNRVHDEVRLDEVERIQI